MRRLYFRLKRQCCTTYAPAPCFAPRPFQIRTRVPSGFAHRGAHWWRPIGTNYGPCYSRIIRCLGPRTFWPDCIAPQRPLETQPYETPQVPLQGLASRCDHVDTPRQAWSLRLQHPWFHRADCPGHRRAARRTIKQITAEIRLKRCMASIKINITQWLMFWANRGAGEFVNPILT